MDIRPRLRVGKRGAAVLSTGVAALAVPAVVPAATDAQESTSTGGAQAQQPDAQLRVSARKHANVDTNVPVKGSISTGESGKTILVQRYSKGRWKTIARTRTSSSGRFSARWHAGSPGRFSVRVRTASTDVPPRKVRGKVTVYRRAHVSWYGGSLYGNRTACGGRLTPSRLGVAHKTLPCGTKVSFRYRGHTVTVPVIDRGPYVAGREYDLTEATKNRLHFDKGVGTVGASR